MDIDMKNKSWVGRNRKTLFEPPHDKTNKMACAPSEDSDQPGHLRSLIRIFAGRMKKPWVLIYPLSAQRRLWSDWADAQTNLSLRWAHTHFVGFDMRQLILSANTLTNGTEHARNKNFPFPVQMPCKKEVNIQKTIFIQKLLWAYTQIHISTHSYSLYRHQTPHSFYARSLCPLCVQFKESNILYWYFFSFLKRL